MIVSLSSSVLDVIVDTAGGAFEALEEQTENRIANAVHLVLHHDVDNIFKPRSVKTMMDDRDLSSTLLSSRARNAIHVTVVFTQFDVVCKHQRAQAYAYDNVNCVQRVKPVSGKRCSLTAATVVVHMIKA